jgi:hypothetical protein
MALTGLKGRLAAAQPTDIVFIGYVSLSGLAVLLFGWRLSTGLWVGLTVSHLALIAVALWFAARPLQYPSFGGIIRDIYPLFAIVFLYWELRYLALLFSSGYNDPLILRLEEWLFGAQLAMTFSERFPYMWLSEAMHFFYGLYWVLLPLAVALLYARRRPQCARELVYVELVVFFGCYLVFLFFPVQGPHYEFPVIGPPLADGPMYRFVHWVLEDGGSKGAAFPSSHDPAGDPALRPVRLVADAATCSRPYNWHRLRPVSLRDRRRERDRGGGGTLRDSPVSKPLAGWAAGAGVGAFGNGQLRRCLTRLIVREPREGRTYWSS